MIICSLILLFLASLFIAYKVGEKIGYSYGWVECQDECYKPLLEKFNKLNSKKKVKK